MFEEIEKRLQPEKLVPSETEGFLRNFHFSHTNGVAISNIVKKIEKERKKKVPSDTEIFIDEKGFPTLFRVTKKQSFSEALKGNKILEKQVNFLCTSKICIKRAETILDILEENNFDKELINNIRKKDLINIAKISYQNEEYDRSEEDNRNNNIIVQEAISALLEMNRVEKDFVEEHTDE